MLGIDESYDPSDIASWAGMITEVVNSCPPSLYPGELAQAAGELRAAFDEVLNQCVQLSNYADSSAIDDGIQLFKLKLKDKMLKLRLVLWCRRCSRG